jgi:hypothetical protein
MKIIEKLNQYGLEIKIESVSFDSYYKNHEIIVAVYNNTNTMKKINILKSFYYTKKREQIDQDDFLSGYMKENDTLLTNSHKKTGLVYKQSKLNKINSCDILVFNIELVDECDTLSVCFKNNDNEWVIIEDSTLTIQFKPNEKQIEKYLNNHVERLEAFEERFGVIIQNISFKVFIFDQYRDAITVFCEVHSVNSSTLKSNMQIEFIAYSKTGSILDVGVYSLNVDNFFGFEICNKDLHFENVEEVGKIRIYPHS